MYDFFLPTGTHKQKSAQYNMRITYVWACVQDYLFTHLLFKKMLPNLARQPLILIFGRFGSNVSNVRDELF